MRRRYSFFLFSNLFSVLFFFFCGYDGGSGYDGVGGCGYDSFNDYDDAGGFFSFIPYVYRGLVSSCN